MAEGEVRGFSSTEYKRRFNEQAYDRLNLVVPKGRKELIEALAASRGESVNGLIGDLLRQEMGMTETEWKGSGVRSGSRQQKSPASRAARGASPEENGTRGGGTLPDYLL